jgi:hypothetical protein
MSDSLHDRGRAMEDLFFAESDQRLLDKIREEMEAKDAREALQMATGISDTTVLDAFIENGITPETMVSIGLIPLVMVAWSDHRMESAEKAAILKAADQAGIGAGSPSYHTIESWLSKKPDSDLLDAWVRYIGLLKETLDGAAFSQLKKSIIGRAEHVAESAGGFLRVVNTVSAAERKVLDRLTAAFD